MKTSNIVKGIITAVIALSLCGCAQSSTVQDSQPASEASTADTPASDTVYSLFHPSERTLWYRSINIGKDAKILSVYAFEDGKVTEYSIQDQDDCVTYKDLRGKSDDEVIDLMTEVRKKELGADYRAPIASPVHMLFVMNQTGNDVMVEYVSFSPSINGETPAEPSELVADNKIQDTEYYPFHNKGTMSDNTVYYTSVKYGQTYPIYDDTYGGWESGMNYFVSKNVSDIELDERGSYDIQEY